MLGPVCAFRLQLNLFTSSQYIYIYNIYMPRALCNRDADSLWSAVRLRISFRELGLRGVVWRPVSGWLRRLRGTWCPVLGGSDLILPAGACLNNEVRSHQDQRQEAKVKSEGKRRSSSSASPGGRQETKKRNTNVAEIIRSCSGRKFRITASRRQRTHLGGSAAWTDSGASSQ